MSGIVKSVKKVFKKVGNVVKTYAPVALAAAAIFFTASGAISSGGQNWGGWGDTVSKAVGSMGASNILGDVLAGAVTQAGYGAIAGGVMGAMGGDVMGGMQLGAAGGALVGGVAASPLFNYGTSTLPSKLEGAATPSDGITINGVPKNASVTVGTDTIQPDDIALGGIEDMAPKVSAAPKSWYENEMAVSAGGGLAKGLGAGLIGWATAGDEAKALERKAELEAQAKADERAAISANYQSNGNGLLSGLTQEQIAALNAQRSSRGYQTPVQAFPRWVLDRNTGRLVPATQAA